MTADELIAAQRLVRRIPVGDSVVEAILKLVRAGRPEDADLAEATPLCRLGAGPRASQALMLACRARALHRRPLCAPSVDDVRGAGRRRCCAIAWRSASPARAEGIGVTQVIEQMTAPLR